MGHRGAFSALLLAAAASGALGAQVGTDLRPEPVQIRAGVKKGELVIDAIKRKTAFPFRREGMKFKNGEELAAYAEKYLNAKVNRDSEGKVTAIGGTTVMYGLPKLSSDDGEPLRDDPVAAMLGGEEGAIQVGAERMCFYGSTCLTRTQWKNDQQGQQTRSLMPNGASPPADVTVCTRDRTSCVTTHSWSTYTFFYNSMGASTEQTRGSTVSVGSREEMRNHLSVSIRWIGYYYEGLFPVVTEAFPEGASAPNVRAVSINKWGLIGNGGSLGGIPSGRNWYPSSVCSKHSAGQANGEALFSRTSSEFGPWYTNGVDSFRLGYCPPNY